MKYKPYSEKFAESLTVVLVITSVILWNVNQISLSDGESISIFILSIIFIGLPLSALVGAIVAGVWHLFSNNPVEEHRIKEEAKLISEQKDQELVSYYGDFGAKVYKKLGFLGVILRIVFSRIR